MDCVESSSLIPPCPDRPKTQCEHHRDSAQDGFSLVGALIPECDEEGQGVEEDDDTHRAKKRPDETMIQRQPTAERGREREREREKERERER